MANRAILGQRGSQHGMWVSKPGQNVETAPGAQMLFNANFPAFGILEQGVQNVTWSFGGSGTQVADYSATAMFSNNYSAPPLVWFDLLIGSYAATFPQGMSNTLLVVVTGGTNQQLRADYRVSAEVLQDRIIFTGRARRTDTGYIVPSIQYRWTVFSASFA